MTADTLGDWMEPLGAPGWADDVAADSRADDDRFTITDDRAASWALRKRAKATADVHRVTADVGERRELLDAYQDHATASARHTIEFMDGLLADYHRQVLAEDPDRKTIDLPEGRIRSTTPKKPTIVLDGKGAAARLLEWSKKNLPDLVEYEEVGSIAADVVKANVKILGDRVVLPTAEGEMVDVDGFRVKPIESTFSIDTDGVG